MTTDLHRESPLFDRELHMEVTSSGNDARTNDLIVRIINGTRQSVQGQSEKIIHFEVTDEADPYFLYMLDVGEQDFHTLKREQSILVEFSLFPSMFIELLSHCASTNINNNMDGEQKDAPSFLARIDSSTGNLSIIEVNNFKQITHISIQLRPGNDASIKAYLASRLSHMCSVARQVRREADGLQDQLSAEKSMRRDMTEELRELRTHRDVDMQSVKASHSEEMSRLQVRSNEALENERTQRVQEVSALRKKTDEMAATASSRIAELEVTLGNEARQRAQLDFRCKELERDLESLTSDRDRMLAHTKDNDEEHKALVQKNGNLEREVARLGARCEALEGQMSDKDAGVARAEDLLRAAEASRTHADEKLGLYHNSVQTLKDKLTSAVAEINKGNQLISSMQTDAQRSREIISAKNEVLRRQEASISELRARMGECERRVEAAEDKEGAKENELATVRRELSDVKDRLREGAEVIASNQDVIKWLNRELSRYQLSGPGAGGASPDSVAGLGMSGRSTAANFTPDSLMAKARGTPDTALTGDTGTTRDTGHSSIVSGLSGPVEKSSNMHHHKRFMPDTYKDSYEYLRAIDGGLGGMDDVDMEALGLGGAGASAGADASHYYDGLLDVAAGDGLVRAGAPPSGTPAVVGDGALKYAWQAADFGLDQ